MGPGPFPNAGTVLRDGQFRFTNVPPGRYFIDARAVEGGSGGRRTVWGRSDVIVGEAEAISSGVDLFPSLKVSGRVNFNGKPVPTAVRMTVSLRPVHPWQGDPPVSAQPDSSSHFEIEGLWAGRYRFLASVDPSDGLADRWRLKSIWVGGIDVMDSPFLLSLSDAPSDVVVEFTDFTQAISGRLLRQDGATPNSDAVVLVFSTDDRYWTPLSRRVQYARPATDGSFELAELPIGSYRLVAVLDPDPDDFRDPRYLQSLVAESTIIELALGEKKAVQLRTTR